MAKSLKTALILDPINGDNIVILATAGSVAITGKATGSFESGDIVTVSVNDATFTGTVNNLGVYSINVNATDLISDINKKVEASIAATVIIDGDKQTADAAQYYAVEDCDCVGEETKTALVIDPVTDDNIITSDESSGDITITGRVTNVWALGDVVTLVSNGTAFTGTAAVDGTFSIDIPAADLLADGDLQLDGSVTGTGGTLAYGIQIYIKHYTGSILLRRGPSADRLAFVPLDGEIIYDNETKELFVGDGETYGGVPVGSSGGGGGGSSNSFVNIVVAGQSNVIADTSYDSLTLIAGAGITITTNATSDSITFTSSVLDTNTTYSISSEVVASGANLRLTGSDSSTDNVKFTGAGGITVSRTDASTITVTGSISTINDLTDVQISSPSNNQVLKYNGTYWYNGTDATTGGGSASNSFETIAVSGQSSVVADSSTDTLTLVAGTGITITTDATSDSITITNSATTVSNSFETIAVVGQSSVVADSATDTLTYVAGTGISITTDAGTDSITFTNTGIVTVSPAETATGTDQSTAAALTSTINNITTAAASTGVKLPTAVAGTRLLVFNHGLNSIAVYPDTGAAINSLGTNIAFSLDVGTRLEFVAISTTQWYTLNATFA